MAWWGGVLKRIKKAFGYGGGVRYRRQQVGRLPYRQPGKGKYQMGAAPGTRATYMGPQVGGGRVIGRRGITPQPRMPPTTGEKKYTPKELWDILTGKRGEEMGLVGEPVGIGPAGPLVNIGGLAGKVGIGTMKAGKFVTPSTKAAGLAKGILGKVFSAKTMAIMGTAAGTLFLGLWGQAEAPEAINIPLRDALKQAQQTGNWSIYNEASAAKDEITNLETWEKIMLWTPFASPFIGVVNKMKGVIKGGQILDKIAENERIQQETGETDEQKWIRINADRAAQEIDLINYYNEQRQLMVQWERQAEIEARNEDAAFWRKQREEMFKLEAEERKAQMEFWLEYRKEVLRLEKESREAYIKMWEEQQPSQLGFGLL